MAFCTKCGKEITDPSGKCPECEPVIQKPTPVCSHCGAEIAEGSEICMSCGCKIEATSPTEPEKKSGLDIKKIIIIAASAVALIGIIIGGLFVHNHMRKQEVIEQLSGNTYRYFDTNVYYALGKYDVTINQLSFDDNGECEYYYYYSNVMDEGTSYDRTYKVAFEGDKVYLKMGIDTYEVRYNNYGEIDSIYDSDRDETYEKK